MWEGERDFQVSLCARVEATLRNSALDVAFKPPEGKYWTPQMLMPGYKVEAKPGDFDWRSQKALMNLINKKPDPRQRRADAEAQRSTRERFQMAKAAKLRGATSEEIRLILEA